MLPAVIEEIARKGFSGQSQTGEASYCSLISKADGRIDWALPADAIDARIRAYTPWPLSWAIHGDQCLYILEAAPHTGDASEARPGTVLGTDDPAGILVQTGRGILGLTRLQYRAKKALPWRDFLNGARNFLTASLS
jgi:methionyl-tRNA formyltransferase